ncbi:hypothetical protein [Nonomuraea sp. NPDC049784]|uniref:LGFP repeat-containing protein n=1 Tax=Nonomuraea sp. NPDC049784 TaxID=3154361 RepID=UPI0033D8C152
MFKTRALLSVAATITAMFAILTPAAHATASACDPALVAPAGSLIGKLWRSNGGPASVYGCPVTKEFGYPDKRGSWQQFRNGRIVWSPNLGNGALLRVYRAANKNIVFRWSGLGRDWDFFNVREVFEPGLGNPTRQVKVARIDPWSGLHWWNAYNYAQAVGDYTDDSVSHGTDTDIIRFSVQGCDRGTFSSDCGPWSISIDMIT